MAANINSIAYVGEKPWHGLGTKMDSLMTSAEAIKAAGLDWKVTLEDVFTSEGLTPDYSAVVRGDTKDVLGIVQSRYHPLQNSEAFSFFDAIVGEKRQCTKLLARLGKAKEYGYSPKSQESSEL